MSVEKYRELGKEAYQKWRAEEVAKRKLRKPGEVVYVDREVIVQAEPEVIEIPRFLAPDPVTEFIESERRSDETDAETRKRLWLELEILLNRAKDGPLPEADEARKRQLTSGLKGID